MSTTPLLIVFPRGQISELDKARMAEAGLVAVEADDPEKVVQLQTSTALNQSLLTGDGIVRAALESLAKGNDTTTMKLFVVALQKAIGGTP